MPKTATQVDGETHKEWMQPFGALPVFPANKQVPVHVAGGPYCPSRLTPVLLFSPRALATLCKWGGCSPGNSAFLQKTPSPEFWKSLCPMEKGLFLSWALFWQLYLFIFDVSSSFYTLTAFCLSSLKVQYHWKQGEVTFLRKRCLGTTLLIVEGYCSKKRNSFSTGC